MLFATLISEIALLWILSPYVIQIIFTFLMLLFPSRAVAVALISAFLFPGTIIHELSHLFTAEILGVKAGKLDLVPDNIQKPEVVTGTVSIAKTDRVRKTIIGLSPLFSGLILVTSASYFLSLSVGETLQAFELGNLFAHPSLYVTICGVYLIFAISNSMFPSHIDLKGTPIVIAGLIVLSIILYLLGIRIILSGEALFFSNKILYALVQSLGLVVALNSVVLVILKLNIRIMTRLLGIRLVSR